MTKIDYRKFNLASSFPAHDYLRKAANPANFALAQFLADCTERDGIDLHFINYGKSVVPCWKALDMDNDSYKWWILCDSGTLNTVDMNDFDRLHLKSTRTFKNFCKKHNLTMQSVDDASRKSKNQSSKNKNFGFDLSSVDQIWRKLVYKNKKLTREEVKQLAAACKELVDKLADKDPGMLGARVYTTLCKSLGIYADHLRQKADNT